MAETDRIRKLRWMCRRGMKELDILLESFLNRNIEALRQGQWPEFERLLSMEDDQLWALVLDPDTASEKEFQPLIQTIHGSLRSSA